MIEDIKEVTKKDIPIIYPYFRYNTSRCAGFTIGVYIYWSKYLKAKYIIIDKTLLFEFNIEKYGNVFTIPIGENVNAVIDKLYKEYSENGKLLQFIDVTENDFDKFKCYDIETIFNDDWSDYIYNASDLIKLSGRKYHGQKNHINYFIKTNSNFSFETIDKTNIENVKKFLFDFSKIENKGTLMFDEEIEVSKNILDDYFNLNFKGLVLKVNGNIIAFSVGEILGDTMYVHIEKADKNYRGAYPIIMNEFVKRYARELKFINREDSAGDIGLKTSKLQYHPCLVLKKYLIKINGKV